MSRIVEIAKGEAGAQLAEVAREAAERDEAVVISNDGNAQAAVIPLSELARLDEPKRVEELAGVRERALKAIAGVRAWAARTGANKLTDEEIDEAVQAVRRDLCPRPLAS